MSATEAPRSLLLVEDEMLLAMLIEHVLCDNGYRVLKAARLPAALRLVDTEHFDAALLDINLAGTEVFPLAEVLRARGIPFLFTSGYGDHGLPPAMRIDPRRTRHSPDLVRDLGNCSSVPRYRGWNSGTRIVFSGFLRRMAFHRPLVW